MKKTKIICTVGDITSKKKYLKKFLLEGMNIMRINLSHGNKKEHIKKVINFLQVKKELKINAGILIDTKGPEIRTLNVENNKPIFIKNKQEFIFSTDQNIIGNEKIIGIDYINLINLLNINDVILVDDGNIIFNVININHDKKHIICKACNDGYINSKKGINIPKLKIDLPILSEKDKISIKEIIKITDIEFIALSFVRNNNDLIEVRNFLKKINPNYNIKLISKIENYLALKNINEIIKISDGIMIARGDLAVEIPLEKIIIIQKKIIQKCNNLGKLVITATQMLDTMINNFNPTRAEISDISNAILDGSDALMLSAETAIGKYPINSLKLMSKICTEIDYSNYFNKNNYKILLKNKKIINNDLLEHISKNIINFSNNNFIKLIILVTNNNNFFYYIKKFNINSNIIILTNNKNILYLSLLSRGIYSFYIKDINVLDIDKIYNIGTSIGYKNNYIKKNDYLLIYNNKYDTLNKFESYICIKSFV